MKRVSRLQILKLIEHRGTRKTIQRSEAIVYDYMPVLLGDRFRNDPILKTMLLRPAPVTGPFMVQADAYEILGLQYIKKGEVVPALECYRISLESRTGFARAIQQVHTSALLTKEEIDHMSIHTSLEEKIARHILISNPLSNTKGYTEWIEDLRNARKEWNKLNKDFHGSPAYIEACIRIGRYEEAHSCAKTSGDTTIARRIKRETPKEILDIPFLKQYMRKHMPESTIGG